MPHLPRQVARPPRALVAWLGLAAAALVAACPVAPEVAPPPTTEVDASSQLTDAPERGRFVSPGVATLAYPTRVAVAADGVVLVSDPVANAVFGYRDGRRVLELVDLARPLGLAVHGARLYVGCAGRGTVEVYDLDARAWVGDLGGAPVRRPNAIAVAPDGVIYVADSDADQVRFYDPATLGALGTLGGSGELRFPVAVAADVDTVVVADQGHHRLVRYGRDGAELGALGHEIALTATSRRAFHAGFTRLQGVALWRGAIYALDSHHAHVQALDADGGWRGSLGRAGGCATCVSLPLDVAVTPAGHVLVTDPERQRWVDLGPLEEAAP